jgi:Transglycosylase-like domain
LHGGSAAPGPSADAAAAAGGGPGLTSDRAATAVRDVADANAVMARRRNHAALAAARAVRQREARREARRQAQRQAQQAAAQAPPPSAPPPPSTGGADAAHSALGICIRNAEQGGSYAWGPGNGGGAYQFLLSTWEHYGGAASEFGVAGPAYQDQIFDNAIAAGGASNWTNYDGC